MNWIKNIGGVDDDDNEGDDNHYMIMMCQSGASLLSIGDPAESHFIQESIEQLQDSTKSFWIGLHKSNEGQRLLLC